MAFDFSQNTMQIISWAAHGQIPSAMSQKDAMTGTWVRNMVPKSLFLATGFVNLRVFAYSILEVIYNRLFKDCQNVTLLVTVLLTFA